MSGRAINKDLTDKEGQLYNAWMQMDFKETNKNGNYQLKHFHQNYGFNLEKELDKHPIKELTNEQDKTRLIESLQKGNKQSVTFIKAGNEEKIFIEANPRFKAINVYDGNMQRLGSRQTKDEKQVQGENNAAKHETKKENRTQSNDDDNPDVPRATKKRTKKQSPSV